MFKKYISMIILSLTISLPVQAQSISCGLHIIDGVHVTASGSAGLPPNTLFVIFYANERDANCISTSSSSNIMYGYIGMEDQGDKNTGGTDPSYDAIFSMILLNYALGRPINLILDDSSGIGNVVLGSSQTPAAALRITGISTI